MAHAKDLRLSLQHTKCPVPKNNMKTTVEKYSLIKDKYF